MTDGQNGLGLPMPEGAAVPPSTPNIHKTLLEPINFGLAASCRKALELGIPSHEMIGMLLNHLASVVSMVEPAGAREQVIRDLVSAFAPMVRQHVDARLTTPGGIFLPQAGRN